MDEHDAGEPTVTPEGALPEGGHVQVPTPEVLDSGAAPAWPAPVGTAPTWSVLPAGVEGEGAPSGRGRSRALVAGITAAAVLVTAGGGYAAWSRLNGNGPQPAEVLPASTVAFAEVDLDPSVGQKLALYNLLKKFPRSSGLLPSDKDFGDWLVRRLAEGSTDGNDAALDFTKDVQPWLGKRFAVAAVPAPAGSGAAGSSVDGVVVVQETDEKAAAAAMDKLRKNGSEHLGYAFLDGYLVVTPGSDTGAARVVSGAQKAPLSSAGSFTSDLGSLGSDQVVTAWMDASKAGQLLKDQMGSMAGAGQLDSMFGQTWKGRWVLGVHAADQSVEMRVRTFGSTAATSPAPPVKIEHVAPDTFAVLAVSGYAKTVADGWSKISSTPGYSTLADQASAMGLTLPDDLEALLGDQLTISVGGDLSQEPSVLAAATSRHPEAGKAVLDKLLALAGPDGVASAGLTTRVAGDTLYVGSSAGAVSAGRGTTAAALVTDSDLFKSAVADPEHAQVVLYVNLVRLWSSLKSSGTPLPSPELTSLKAVGVSSVSSGDGSDTVVRVVLG